MFNLLWLFIIIPVLIIVWLLGIYNSLVRSKIRTDEAWSDIDVQLKRRYNLIPNLMETVKGYAAHEKDVFEKVTNARAAAINARGLKEQGQAENMLSGALKSLFAVAEAYPDLKANQNFLELQRELTDTEDKIQAARRFYNGVVRDFNTAVQVFPNSLVASMFNFKSREFFELGSEAEKEPVKVSF
jgi:LemA protein